MASFKCVMLQSPKNISWIFIYYPKYLSASKLPQKIHIFLNFFLVRRFSGSLNDFCPTICNWTCYKDNSALPIHSAGIVIWDALTLPYFYFFHEYHKNYFHVSILESLPFFVIRYKNTYKQHVLSICRTHFLSPIVPIQKITSSTSSVLSWSLGHSAFFVWIS